MKMEGLPFECFLVLENSFKFHFLISILKLRHLHFSLFKKGETGFDFTS